MNRKELVKRFEEGLLEMYNLAENAAGIQMHFESYNDLIDHLQNKKHDIFEKRTIVVLPYSAFYLDKATQDEIVQKAIKGCRYYWRYPGKIPIGGDRKFDKYVKELKQYEEEKKNLSRWFRKKRMDEIVKKYNLQYRSYEAESIQFELWNISPNISKESFEKYKDQYQKFLKGEKIEEKYQEDIVALDYLIKSYKASHV